MYYILKIKFLVRIDLFLILALLPSGVIPINSEAIRDTEPVMRSLIYRPRAENLPAGRIDGSSRSSETGLPSLYVLAPGHIGATISTQPTLFWYQSQPTGAQFELVIIGEDKTKPIFEKKFDSAGWSGIKEINLTDFGIELSKGIPYMWSVSIIPEPEHRSKDIIAAGTIVVIDPSKSLASALITKSQEDLVYILSEEGIWYDALEKISRLIALQPERSELRVLRAELLDQVNLVEVAEYDREMITSGMVSDSER